MKRKEGHHRDTEITERKEAGIVLILVSGVLVLIALMGAAFIQVSALHGKGQAGRTAAEQARIVAEAGMEYAAARLAREKADLSVPRVVAARGDDWQYRGGGGIPTRAGGRLCELSRAGASGRRVEPLFQ